MSDCAIHTSCGPNAAPLVHDKRSERGQRKSDSPPCEGFGDKVNLQREILPRVPLSLSILFCLLRAAAPEAPTRCGKQQVHNKHHVCVSVCVCVCMCVCVCVCVRVCVQECIVHVGAFRISAERNLCMKVTVTGTTVRFTATWCHQAKFPKQHFKDF